MLQFLIDNWGMILTIILAVLGAFKIKLNNEQIKAITIIWNFIDDIIVEIKTKEPTKIVQELKVKAERSENLKNVIQKIEKTDGDNLLTTVSVLAANHDFLKATGKPVWNLLKKFVFPFGKSIFKRF